MGFKVFSFQYYNSSCFGAWNLKYDLFKFIDAIEQNNFSGILNVTNINMQQWGGGGGCFVKKKTIKKSPPGESGFFFFFL